MVQLIDAKISVARARAVAGTGQTAAENRHSKIGMQNNNKLYCKLCLEKGRCCWTEFNSDVAPACTGRRRSVDTAGSKQAATVLAKHEDERISAALAQIRR
jgi:hypothetical protein